jgi:probable HAF family extracellular repeat protein
MRKSSVGSLAVCLVLAASVPLALAQGSYTQIDYPGARFTAAVGINGAGDVVGGYYIGSEQHGFVFSGGSFTAIDVPGATNTAATGINDTGSISGYFSTNGGHYHGFLFDGQEFEVLDFPGAAQTFALGINNAAQVVGYYADFNRQVHGFEYSNNSFVTIDFPGSLSTLPSGINNSDYVVGYYYDANGNRHSFVFTPLGTFRHWGQDVLAFGVNDHNTIVGFKFEEDFGFRFHPGRKLYVRMQVPHSLQTICFGINATGRRVVGRYSDAGGNVHGFIWTPPADAAKK